MTDLKAFENLIIKRFGMDYTRYDRVTDKRWMNESALRCKAETAYYIRGIDYYFDKNGEFIGTCSESLGSWQKASKEKK